MKLLILSDTHGRSDRVIRVLKLHADADAILFLGDGISDMARSGADIGRLFCVRGNCDTFSLGSNIYSPDELSLCFDGYNILMMHGHSHGVKSGLERAMEYAAAKGADVLLFGHTHTPLEKYIPANSDNERPMYLFNPGSLGAGRGGTSSYGLIQIKNRHILFSHGSLK
ncbi:MAG: metallophosphoesterase [Clostridia bacterium]|nr:metallophosphoesterase [Clostridia bacterium]